MSLSTNQDYKDFFADIKHRIQHAQVKAVVAVNQQMLLLYREIGSEILQRQKTANWGNDVIGQLSQDLKKSFPSMKGFSKRNLQFMRQFAETYPDSSIVKQPVSQISRSHNILLMQRCYNNKERLWYAEKALEYGRSRSIMTHHIELNLYERKGKAVNNFTNTLPSPQSDMAQQALKDPYIFDFLTLAEGYHEKDMENGLVEHITKFLLELGV